MGDSGVELEKIVVNPDAGNIEEIIPPDFDYEDKFPSLDLSLDGRVLSVDRDTEFVIVNIGENQGISIGNVLSVYRNNNYMGDIKVTRTQAEMSAADLIQPLSIRKIKKDDQIKTKQ